MDMKQAVASWVRSARQQAGLSQGDLGTRLALELRNERGNTKANISHWETAKHSPSLEQLMAISRITSVPLPQEITGVSGGPRGEEERATDAVGTATDSVPLLRRNLQWLIEQHGTTPYELQRSAGVPQPTIFRILSGESSDPRTSTLQPLADHFGVTVSDLRDRDLANPGAAPTPPIGSNASFRAVEVVGDDDPRMVQVPKVRLRVAAGISGFDIEPELFDGATMTVSREWCSRHGYDPKLLLWVRVAGRSMEGTLFDGDYVLIYTGLTEPKDGKIFAVNFDGEPVIKRLTRDQGKWWLTSDNPDPQYYRRECQDMKIIGQAVLKHSEAL